MHAGHPRRLTTVPQQFRPCLWELPLEGVVTLFRRGDANTDSNSDLSDAVFVLSYLFIGGTAPACEDASDADVNESLEITDAVYLLA